MPAPIGRGDMKRQLVRASIGAIGAMREVNPRLHFSHFDRVINVLPERQTLARETPTCHLSLPTLLARIWKPFLSAGVGLEASDTTRGNLTCESCGMMRWIFRLIAVAVVGKFLNRYLATQRTPEPRRP